MIRRLFSSFSACMASLVRRAVSAASNSHAPAHVLKKIYIIISKNTTSVKSAIIITLIISS